MPKPTDLLAPCPGTPNCVSTLAAGRYRIDPIPYRGTPAAARERLLAVLRDLPLTRIVRQEPHYLHAECRTLLLRYVDDVEFVFDDRAAVIQFRSASRTGYYDLGVNRRRMETIHRRYLSQAPGVSDR
ncbi:MAG: DUF1499 domain-containing protein [Acidobacteriota bacterium]|nr:DUF1499 domain-containing protein [Acidobacteriota bacterium]